MCLKRLIFLAAALFVSGSLMALAEDSVAIRQAEAALHDGLYKQAGAKLVGVFASDLSKSELAQAVLLQAHVLYGSEAYDELERFLKKHSRLLKKEKLAGDRMYWIALSASAQGRIKESLEALDTLPNKSSSLYEPAHWLKARLFLQREEYIKAAKIFNVLSDEKISTRIKPASLLHWATLLIASSRHEEAGLLLRKINEVGSDTEKTEAQYWAARLLSEAGEWEQAEKLLKEVTTAQTASPELLGQAWQSLADGYLAGGSITNALLALKQGQQLASDRSQVLTLQIKQLSLHMQQADHVGAEALVRKLIAEHGEVPELGESLLILAESFLDAGQPEKAFKLFHSYMDVFTDTQGRARAMAGKAWSYSQQKDPTRALEWFKKARDISNDVERKKSYTLYYADALYAAGSFDVARLAYIEYAQDYPGAAQQPQALFQAALCLVEQTLYPEAALELKRLAELYSDNDMAQRARLQLAMLKERQNDYRGAIEMYDRYLDAYSEGSFVTTVVLKKGMALYRLGDFGDALNHFKKVATLEGGGKVKERALYLEGWATYLDQGADKALPLFSSFIEKYPESEWAEHVLFWQAETHFNKQNFEKALQEYTRLVETFPRGALLEKALYWAGRSAMNLKEYVQAIQSFKRVVDDFPESARRADALFWEGDALTALGEFDAAVLVFDRLIKELPDSYLVCSAWGRKGDCYFNLADRDAARYDQALDVYKKLSDLSDICSRDLQLQALYKQARVMEALKHSDEALLMYEQVVYDFLEYRSDLSRESAVYFSRSAFAAAQLYEQTGQWRQAIALYRRVGDARVEASDEADQRMNKLRIEKVILF